MTKKTEQSTSAAILLFIRLKEMYLLGLNINAAFAGKWLRIKFCSFYSFSFKINHFRAFTAFAAACTPCGTVLINCWYRSEIVKVSLKDRKLF